MPPYTSMRCALLAACAAALMLSACGRRGPLDRPTDTGLVATPSQPTDNAGKATDAATGAGARNVVAPKGPFILDPLL